MIIRTSRRSLPVVEAVCGQVAAESLFLVVCEYGWWRISDVHCSLTDAASFILLHHSDS